MSTCLSRLVKPFGLDRCNWLCVTWCRMSFVDSSGSMLDFNVDSNEAMKFNPSASCVFKFTPLAVHVFCPQLMVSLISF